MNLGAEYLWLIPVLPLLASLISLLIPSRAAASFSAIGAMLLSLLLSLVAFAETVSHPGHHVFNFSWLTFGASRLSFGFLLDPLTGCMLVMVTFVGLLIFIYSTGYMAADPNYAKFFCFMSLFAAGMLGVIVANSLLLLFIAWEIVGLASYLLIGFWFFKPSAALAARKAFITTRIGDVAFFIGVIWLQSCAGTLLFYDNGRGCLEPAATSKMLADLTFVGLPVISAIALLIFCGAAGKSGQVPFHVWLPDAMEGPTPVSALIHAATMVAAGVFLVARVYPLMEATPAGSAPQSIPLIVITWVGAITALFAALIAVAQNDIKRILAYSTVSQLGYMMMGLGVGGIFVGIFHLITHAFFKALLFLGAGSVIHGAHEEQDITRLGGLKKTMPVTFFAYAVGMMALSGVPLLFSGFWSKDEILHSALNWPVSKLPFILGLLGAFLTAFYMTRQVVYVFYGVERSKAHENKSVFTVPLMILAGCSILLGFIGTPFWPWFAHYLEPTTSNTEFASGFSWEWIALACLSAVVVLGSILIAWNFYLPSAREEIIRDPLQRKAPGLFTALAHRLYIDELYEGSIIEWTRQAARVIARCEETLFDAIGRITALITLGFGWASRLFDRFVIDFGFDQTCRGLVKGAEAGTWTQSGTIQVYLRNIAVTLAILIVLLAWGCKGT